MGKTMENIRHNYNMQSQIRIGTCRTQVRRVTNAPARSVIMKRRNELILKGIICTGVRENHLQY
jgi:hypothetical protein